MVDAGSLLVRILAKVVCAIVQANGRAVRPAGRAQLLALAEKVIRADQRFPIAAQIGVLAGFDVVIHASDSAATQFHARGGGPLLALVNHFADCPLGVVGNAIATAHGLKTTFDVDATVVFGVGASVVTLLRERSSRVTDVVMVGGPTYRIGNLTLLGRKRNRAAEIDTRLRAGEAVFLYPERKNSAALFRGDFRSGRIILHAAEQGIPVIPVALYFAGGVFHVCIGPFLDEQRVLDLSQRAPDKVLTGQSVVDYAMDEIAVQLPACLRGAYAPGKGDLLSAPT